MVDYIENTGRSVEEAIVIRGAVDNFDGIASEYSYLEQKFGKRDKDWSLLKQELIEDNNRKYDKLTISLSSGGERVIYFDITDFFGKF